MLFQHQRQIYAPPDRDWCSRRCFVDAIRRSDDRRVLARRRTGVRHDRSARQGAVAETKSFGLCLIAEAERSVLLAGLSRMKLSERRSPHDMNYNHRGHGAHRDFPTHVTHRHTRVGGYPVHFALDSRTTPLRFGCHDLRGNDKRFDVRKVRF